MINGATGWWPDLPDCFGLHLRQLIPEIDAQDEEQRQRAEIGEQPRQRAANFVHGALQRGADPAGMMGGGRNGLKRLHETPEKRV